MEYTVPGSAQKTAPFSSLQYAKLLATNPIDAGEEDFLADSTLADVKDNELIFFHVASSNPTPAGYMQAVADCIGTARKKALEARKPPKISAMIDATFRTSSRSTSKHNVFLQPKTTSFSESAGVSSASKLPIVGLSTQTVDRDPVVASLRQEKQLWRLVGLVLEQHAPAQLDLLPLASQLVQFRKEALRGDEILRREGAEVPAYLSDTLPFSVAASFPCDAVANERYVVEALASFDAELSLLQLMLQWLHQSAEEDAQITAPSGHVTTPAAAELMLSEPAESADGYQASVLSPERLMWADTQKACLKVLDSSNIQAGKGLLDDVMQEALQAAAATSKTLTEFHPDALVTSNAGNSKAKLLSQLDRLTDADLDTELDLLQSLWALLRSGKPQLGQVLAARYGQPWRSAVLAGTDLWGDESSDPDATNCKMRRRGNPHWVLFQETARAAAQQLEMAYEGEQHGAGFSKAKKIQQLDLALTYHLGSMSSELLNLQEVVQTWEDACWELASAFTRERINKALRVYRISQGRNTSLVPWNEGELPADGCLRTVHDVFAELQASSRRELSETTANSPYVGIASALFKLGAAFSPSITAAEQAPQAEGALQLPIPSRLAVNQALHYLIGELHRAVLGTSDEWSRAVSANQLAMHATVRPSDVPPGCAFSPTAPDALKNAAPLPPDAVAIVRFSVHLLLYLRMSSGLQTEPVLSPSPIPAGENLIATELESMRQSCADMFDDILFVYARHLMICSLQKSLYLDAIMALVVHMAPPRAVRALVSFFVLVPHAPHGTEPSRRQEVFDSFNYIGGNDNPALQQIFAEAIRNTVRLYMSIDRDVLHQLGGDHNRGTADADVLYSAGFHVPPSPPTTLMKLLNVSLVDYVRIASLEWLMLAGDDFAIDLLVDVNTLARFLAAKSVSKQTAVNAQECISAVMWLFFGLEHVANAISKQMLTSKAPGDSTRFNLTSDRHQTDMAQSGEFQHAVLPEGIVERLVRLDANQSVAELQGWVLFATIQSGYTVWSATVAKSLPAAPLVPQSRVGVITDYDRRNYEYAAKLHEALVESRGKEVLDSTRQCLSAFTAFRTALAEWLVDDHAVAKLPSLAPVVGPCFEMAPAAKILRQNLLPVLAQQFIDVTANTAAWLEGDHVAQKLFSEQIEEMRAVLSSAATERSEFGSTVAALVDGALLGE